MNELIDGGLIVGLMLLAFIIGLAAALPMGNWIARRMETWPNRPMDLGEMRAAWAWKHYQIKRALPNSWKWPWRKANEDGTGSFKATLTPSQQIERVQKCDMGWLFENGGNDNE